MTKDDCISRQAAISIVEFECGEWKGLAQKIVNGIKKLPSAQPEIIHCKDCRWWDKYSDYDNGYCMAAAKHDYFSKHWEINIMRTYRGNFYCADAEPKGNRHE